MKGFYVDDLGHWNEVLLNGQVVLRPELDEITSRIKLDHFEMDENGEQILLVKEGFVTLSEHGIFSDEQAGKLIARVSFQPALSALNDLKVSFEHLGRQFFRMKMTAGDAFDFGLGRARYERRYKNRGEFIARRRAGKKR